MTVHSSPRGPLEPDAGTTRTSGSVGAGVRLRTPATRLTYTTVDPPLVTEDDLTVQYDETRSPLPRRPRLKRCCRWIRSGVA